MFLSFPSSSAGKESTCSAGDLGLIPGLGRSPGVGKGYPLQCSGLENSMDCIVCGVAKSQTRLSDFHSHTFYGVDVTCYLNLGGSVVKNGPPNAEDVGLMLGSERSDSQLP